MRKIMGLFTILILLTVTMLIADMNPPDEGTPINNILRNPEGFKHVELTIVGVITQVPEHPSGTSNWYYIKDKFGGVLNVRTAQAVPEHNRKYWIKGTVTPAEDGRGVYLVEAEKICLDCGVVAPPPVAEEEGAVGVEKTGGMEKYAIWIIAGVLLVAGIIILIIALKPRKEEEIIQMGPPPLPTAGPAPAASQSTVQIGGYESKTVKIISSPKTMRFLPCQFELLTGDEKGNLLRMPGYDIGDGSAEVTIGRNKAEDLDPGRQHAHIEFKEMTVSREQAVLRFKDGVFNLKNLSDVNNTIVNGNKLRVNEATNLKSGDKIQIGEVEMRFGILK